MDRDAEAALEKRMEEMEFLKQSVFSGGTETVVQNIHTSTKADVLGVEQETDSLLYADTIAEQDMIRRKEEFHDEVEAAVREIRMEDEELNLRQKEISQHIYHQPYNVRILK